MSASSSHEICKSSEHASTASRLVGARCRNEWRSVVNKQDNLECYVSTYSVVQQFSQGVDSVSKQAYLFQWGAQETVEKALGIGYQWVPMDTQATSLVLGKDSSQGAGLDDPLAD